MSCQIDLSGKFLCCRPETKAMKGNQGQGNRASYGGRVGARFRPWRPLPDEKKQAEVIVPQI